MSQKEGHQHETTRPEGQSQARARAQPLSGEPRMHPGAPLAYLLPAQREHVVPIHPAHLGEEKHK
eukprot:6745987-Alexandrium_andersonii.AAC.1